MIDANYYENRAIACRSIGVSFKKSVGYMRRNDNILLIPKAIPANALWNWPGSAEARTRRPAYRLHAGRQTFIMQGLPAPASIHKPEQPMSLATLTRSATLGTGSLTSSPDEKTKYKKLPYH